MNAKTKKIVGILFLSIFLSQLAFQANLYKLMSNSEVSKESQNEELNPNVSEISGSEAFAEQILVNLAGNQSLIEQRFYTNDSNVFNRIDFADPAFFDAAFMLTLTNGKESNISPFPRSSQLNNTQYYKQFKPHGFIYYKDLEDNGIETIYARKDRLTNIIQETFHFDLIFYDEFLDEDLGCYFPFIISIPSQPIWANYFEKTLSNLPEDGYWSGFNQDRLLDSYYLENHHLSSNLVYLKDFNIINEGLAEYLPYNIEEIIDLQSFSIDQLLTGSTDGINDSIFGDILGINGEETEEEAQESSFLDIFDATGIFETNFVSYSVTFEGKPEGITPIPNKDNQYQADLFELLGFNGTALKVSSKSFNSLMGALMSGIGISLYSAEALSITPEHYFLDDYNLNRIEFLLNVVDVGFDISTIRDYSFNIGWQSDEFLSKLITIPENLNNENDIINYLSLLGSFGLPLIMGGILNPIQSMELTYQLAEHEPSLRIIKEMNTTSNRLDSNSTMSITVENIVDYPVYGQEIDLSILPFAVSNDPYEMATTLNLMVGVDINQVFSTVEDMGYMVDDYFHDDYPRFFLVDSTGSGTFDYIYPAIELTNITTNFMPFSPEYSEILRRSDVLEELGGESSFWGLVAEAMANLFENNNSVYNPDNWVLLPGESFSFETDPIVDGELERYEPLYLGDVGVTNVPGISPITVTGTPHYTSSVEQTESNDQDYWKIESAEVEDIFEVQQYYLFNNLSSYDLSNENSSLNAVNLNIDFNATEGYLESVIIEIFNYTAPISESFVTISEQNYTIDDSGVVDLTLSYQDYVMTDFYDPNSNFSVLFRITYKNATKFSLLLDFIQLSFQKRVNDMFEQSPASITYSTEIGNSIYSIKSNEILLGSYNCSSLTGYIEISNPTSFSGDLQQYNLTIINTGNKPTPEGYAILAQPGIVADLKNPTEIIMYNESKISIQAANFSLIDGNLYYFFSDLQPGEKIENITFNFYTSNSRILPTTYICWEDYFDRHPDRSDYISAVNQVYVSAPINYLNETSKPYLHSLKMSYISNFSEGIAPQIGEQFEVTVKIENTGNHPVYDSNISIPTNVTGLTLINTTTTIWIDKIEPNQSLYFHLVYRKDSFRGYVLPPLELLRSSEMSMIEYQPQNFLLLGIIDFEITKIFETTDASVGTFVNIHVSVQNVGNIEAGNFTINDIWSYDAEGFTITEGVLLSKVTLMRPGESVEFSYKLRVIKEGIHTMNPVRIEYYYKFKASYTGEEQLFKARERYIFIGLKIVGPLSLGALALIGVFRYKTHYSRKEREQERREALLFGQSLRDVSWHKQTIGNFFESDTEEEAFK